MAHAEYAIGLDIGGTHITAGLVHLSDGKLLQDTLSRTTYDHNSEAPHILEKWAEAINQTLRHASGFEIGGIGFAIPGPFEYKNGISRMEHKFKNLFGLHIPTALSPMLQTEKPMEMRFINDASAFAVGESWLGSGAGYEKVLVITLGTGFGSAFIDDGVPIVERADVPKEGCLWYLPYQDDIADAYFSTRWFSKAYAAHTGKTISGVKELSDRIADEEAIQPIFNQFGQNLGEFLAPWLKLYQAEILIIGGNISNALPFFKTAFLASLTDAGVKPEIQVSKLQETGALIGSARLFDQAFWEKLTNPE